MKKTLTALLLAFAGLTAEAQTAASTPAEKTAAPASSVKDLAGKDLTEAEVRKVDKEARKITLKHGPIKNLDMPGMTMVFQVRDTALLDKLSLLTPGDKIMFTAEQQQGAYVVTGAEKLTPK